MHLTAPTVKQSSFLYGSRPQLAMLIWMKETHSISGDQLASPLLFLCNRWLCSFGQNVSEWPRRTSTTVR